MNRRQFIIIMIMVVVALSCLTYTMVYMYVNSNQEEKGLHLYDSDDHVFDGVPINEFANNEDRTGAYEPVLDSIDAYDLSQSELANFQQDAMDAILKRCNVW